MSQTLLFSIGLSAFVFLITFLLSYKSEKKYQERMNRVMSGDVPLTPEEFGEQFYEHDPLEKYIAMKYREILSEATGYNIELIRPEDVLAHIWPDISLEDLVYRLEHTLEIEHSLLHPVSTGTFDEVVKIASGKLINRKPQNC